ncbi:peptidyl-prolyl cis-trans isomerase FKBP12-like [Stegodyphus dumicola]|uniref:peptidyl-prolyl cis-trans isomerase FKBP12-like n=1 Tax=Stegodyphus dumicola TaxID=202533 RepID=UPI0015AA3698|nr:peptidyl-prolyl cis-trans isomerase FKBP12-like [Stegodyphus dumicola]
MMSNVVQVSDGVFKEVLRFGSGNIPQRGSTITVHCTGCLANPVKKFWSTKDPGQSPFTFQVGLGKVIKGWDEACLTMQQGEIARISIRSDKGYGSQGFPAWGIHPNADLQFEIEILSIQ